MLTKTESTYMDTISNIIRTINIFTFTGEEVGVIECFYDEDKLIDGNYFVYGIRDD